MPARINASFKNGKKKLSHNGARISIEKKEENKESHSLILIFMFFFSVIIS